MVQLRNDNLITISSYTWRSTLENLTSHKDLIKTKPSLSEAASTWYPETEVCYMRNKTGFFVAAKGGNNAESHNHNDVGSFELYIDQTPMIIDAGVGAYTRQTFSSERYAIWNTQSNYHNLPIITVFLNLRVQIFALEMHRSMLQNHFSRLI